MRGSTTKSTLLEGSIHVFRASFFDRRVVCSGKVLNARPMGSLGSSFTQELPRSYKCATTNKRREHFFFSLFHGSPELEEEEQEEPPCIKAE